MGIVASISQGRLYFLFKGGFLQNRKTIQTAKNALTSPGSFQIHDPVWISQKLCQIMKLSTLVNGTNGDKML